MTVDETTEKLRELIFGFYLGLNGQWRAVQAHAKTVAAAIPDERERDRLIQRVHDQVAERVKAMEMEPYAPKGVRATTDGAIPAG